VYFVYLFHKMKKELSDIIVGSEELFGYVGLLTW